MTWTVGLSRHVRKQIDRLPAKVSDILIALIRDIEEHGPIRGNWPNYSRLESSRYHCHMKKGKPTYVAIWEVRNIEVRLVEVIYAGTHEKAPY